MRPGPGKLVATAVLVAFAAAGCSGGTPPNLLKEYVDGAEVEFDRFAEASADPQSPVTPPKAYDKASDQLSVLLTPVSCDAYLNQPTDPECFPGKAADVAYELAGTKGEVFARSILVKSDDTMRMHSLLIVRDGDGDKTVVDGTGQTFTGLTDFRENNELYNASDWILVPSDLTKLPKKDETQMKVKAVTVTGHVAGTWGWYFGGAAVLLAVLLAYMWFTRSPDSRKAPDNSDAGMLRSL